MAFGTGRVAVVLKGYPRLSETFIAQEIAALEERGLGIVIVSLRHPTDARTHPVHARIRAPKLYLPEYLREEAGPPLADVSRGPRDVVAGSRARSNIESYPALRTGARARGRAAR